MGGGKTLVATNHLQEKPANGNHLTVVSDLGAPGQRQMSTQIITGAEREISTQKYEHRA